MFNNTNINIAFESLLENKLQSVLTALGIIFGIAAVITMVAIGKGAQQQIIEQIELVGAKNIIIMPKIIGNVEEEDNVAKKFSPKLSINDFEAIKNILPGIEKITPLVSYKTSVIANGKKRNTNLVGVNSEYFSIYNLVLDKGSIFSSLQEKNSDAVCLIGSTLANKIFAGKNCLGKTIRVKKLQLTIIGVIAPGNLIGESLQNIGMNNYNDEIFIPVNTALTRYKDRSRITEKTFSENDNDEEYTNIQKSKIIDQINKIIIGVSKTENISESVDVLYRMLYRRHNKSEDFEIIVPEQILQQKKETDDTFNILLGVIAAISLLVGGIGIMNIMLASVLERIKEIGLRMSIGARKKDIEKQFIYEAGLISLSGGILGIILGIFLSYLVEWITNTPTVISLWSVIISFFVSGFIGVVFGYIPAKKAAEQNPVNSLRHN